MVPIFHRVDASFLSSAGPNIYNYNNGRNVWTKLLPLDLKDRYTALLGVPESHLLDDGVYTCQVLINSLLYPFIAALASPHKASSSSHGMALLGSVTRVQDKVAPCSLEGEAMGSHGPYFTLIDSLSLDCQPLV